MMTKYKVTEKGYMLVFNHLNEENKELKTALKSISNQLNMIVVGEISPSDLTVAINRKIEELQNND